MRDALGKATLLGALAAATIAAPAGTADRVPLGEGPVCTAEQAREIGDTFPWADGSPAEYLKMLQDRGQQRDQPAVYRQVYTICGYHRGWVKEEHVAALVAQVDSREPCPHTVVSLSSYAPLESSFIGQEALFLVDAYRTGVFPPSLHSKDYYRRRQEILGWWKARQTRRR